MFQPNFVKFTNTDIVSREPMGGDFKGNQNNGLIFVQFADGSGGIEKLMKDWHGNKTGRLYPAEILAVQEYLSARVGEVMNAPVRDCRFSATDAKTVIMPFINGESGEELGKSQEDCYPDNAQGGNLRLFDYLTANADRRPKNLMYPGDGRIVGIDHALCNFRPRKATPEVVSALWNAGLTLDALLVLQGKLGALRGEFQQFGMGDKFAQMMENLHKLIRAFWLVGNSTAIQKGDVVGHDFHGNQWMGGGVSTLEKPNADDYDEERLLSMWNACYRYKDGSQYLNREDSWHSNQSDLFRTELFKRNTGGHVEPSDFPKDNGALRGHRDANAEPIQWQCDKAKAVVDKFMQTISDKAAPSDTPLIRGIFDQNGSVLSQFAVGKTVDVPLVSWARDTAENATTISDFASGRYVGEGFSGTPVFLHAPSGTVGADVGYPLAMRQTLTGGQFSVDSISQQADGTHIYLTQKQFYAKSKDWKTADPNYLPGWFPSDFHVSDDFNNAFATLSVAVTKDSLTPPQGVQEAAKRALEWIADGKAGSGFTSVGRKRASDLGNGHSVSEDTLRRMKAYFDRHQSDKDSPHWNEPSPGKVAWYAWGGDAGYSWAKSVVEKLNKVQKGDVDGHDFHGNQYTISMLGGYTYAPEHGTETPHATQNPDGTYTWHQDHQDLVREALRQLKATPVGSGFGLRDEPATSPQTAKAKALYASVLYELQHNATDTPKLYRGSNTDAGFSRPFDEWSESKTIANQFAKKYGGEVSTLPKGSQGIRITDYLGEGGGYLGAEKGWLVAQKPVAKGDVQGHEFHGNQWTQGESGSQGPKLGAFSRNLKEFYDAGGKVERIQNPDEMHKIQEEALVMQNGKGGKTSDTVHTPEERQAQGVRFLSEAALNAEVESRNMFGNPVYKDSYLLVARDANGKIPNPQPTISKAVGSLWAKFAIRSLQKAKTPKDEHLSDKAIELLAQEQEAHEAGDDDKAGQLHYQVLNEVYK